jgi:glycosyltransferase involved in cell wall biosynthesis
MISIIIPMYNAAKTIVSLLESIETQDFRDFEVIIIDDVSTDDSLNLVESFKRDFKIDIYKMSINSGPAAARNFGATKAKCEILFFIDSDVYLEKDVLKNVNEFFKDKEKKCMIGVYSKQPAKPGILATYKALQNYYYYSSTKIDRVSFFWGALGAVRKKIFLEIGDFNTDYKKAEYEDYDFGKRLLTKYPIYLNRDVILRHHFSNNIWKNFKDHFRRSGMWMEIYLHEKKFDNYVTTRVHGFGKLCGFFSILFMLLSFLSVDNLLLSIILFLLFLILNWKFFNIALHEVSYKFFLTTIFYDLVFSLAVTGGVVFEVYRNILGFCFKKRT